MVMNSPIHVRQHPGAQTPDDLYDTPPPWDIGRPQPDFRSLVDTGDITGRVLDIGCGTGEHALMTAALGLDSLGIDRSARAIAIAEEKARVRGLRARFARFDALRVAALEETFDTVLDCGLFHLFSETERQAYVDGLRAAIPAGGRYFMLGLRDSATNDWGSHGLGEHEIAAAFADGWRIETIEPTTIELTMAPGRADAWLAAMTRR
jgi:SAM-dependent methyltransferase